MVTGQNMNEHINCIKILAKHLQGIDDEIGETDLVIILISSFPEEYKHFITALETRADDYLTWNYEKYRLLYEN